MLFFFFLFFFWAEDASEGDEPMFAKDLMDGVKWCRWPNSGLILIWSGCTFWMLRDWLSCKSCWPWPQISRTRDWLSHHGKWISCKWTLRNIQEEICRLPWQLLHSLVKSPTLIHMCHESLNDMPEFFNYSGKAKGIHLWPSTSFLSGTLKRQMLKIYIFPRREVILKQYRQVWLLTDPFLSHPRL